MGEETKTITEETQTKSTSGFFSKIKKILLAIGSAIITVLGAILFVKKKSNKAVEKAASGVSDSLDETKKHLENEEKDIDSLESNLSDARKTAKDSINKIDEILKK